MNDRPVNMGGIHMQLNTIGVDDALKKLDELAAKIKEVNELILALSQMKVDVQVSLVSPDPVLK